MRGRRLCAVLLCAALLLLGGVQRALAAVYWGSSGTQVTRVQQKLKQWGYYDGAVDGVFGQATYDAVIRFQKKNGLAADGVVGPQTLAAMGISESAGTVAASASGSAAYSGDVELLARLIHGEARGEPYVGMVAVGAVVLNRVRSSKFPNTIAGVIYQSGAFDAVQDGQINLTPNEQSRRAARDALNGWDPTGGCLYYYNPATATSKWIWSREVRLNIGAHSFAV
ncbi:MAG: spore cortex-lytic enzyme [Candidatus Ventricola sp.]